MMYAKKRSFALFAMILVALSAFAVIGMSGDADAANINQTDIEANGFVQDKTGTLIVPVTNNDSADIKVIMTVTDAYDSSKVYSKQTIEDATLIAANSTVGMKADFSLGAGEKTVRITLTIVEGDDTFSGDSTTTFTHTIDVASSIWAGISVYLAIIFIVIVVIIGVVYYLRNKPKNKPTTTFTQLEAEKNAAEKESFSDLEAEKKKDTGKVKYVSSRRK